ncbi:MAG: D-alanyl-lipoteichoic acid acyltransferase DltB (MBOAT superfamily) [Bacteriovoracaceae bacterium]|jgi:D-alanyl-lipoteichoic acid acyltransferase DltB (MBOAT superfamily)
MLKIPIEKRKALLIFGLFFNLGLLGYFKYMDFFITNFNQIAGQDLNLFHLMLPLGISFFSLQQITFVVDTYEGLTEERDFLNYALFVSFFPQLIAGPIVHHKEMLPLFDNEENRFFDPKNFSLGIFILAIGLFKKVFIADSLSRMVSNGFDYAPKLTFFEAWTSSLCYTFQLYFDFSGYSDMAIGIALLFNITLPLNFNSPFKSLNIIDFWKCWHITLSRFITTYLYTPMVRSLNKITFNKSMVITLIAMTIAGLWHGAQWTFVLFGFLHGLAIVINHYFKKATKKKFKLNKYFAWFITFNFVNISFVFFRATDISQAIKVLRGMFVPGAIALPYSLAGRLSFLKSFGISFEQVNVMGTTLFYRSLLLLPFLFFIILGSKNTKELSEGFKANKEFAFATAALFILSLLQLNRVQEFLYFNF